MQVSEMFKMYVASVSQVLKEMEVFIEEPQLKRVASRAWRQDYTAQELKEAIRFGWFRLF